jgi:hypothetical protein
MNIMYDDAEYARSRLLTTYVRYKQTVVKVLDINEDMTCDVQNLKTGRMMRTSVEKLNLKSMPLGYVNFNRNCGYLSRIPKRHDWRQGIRAANVSSRELINKGLVNTVYNIYPNFYAALEEVSTGRCNTLAFSREFCINREFSIFYKTMGLVGKVVDKKPVLHKNFFFLDEALQEAINEH